MKNDVHSKTFKSKLDPFFSSAYVDVRGKYVKKRGEGAVGSELRADRQPPHPLPTRRPSPFWNERF